jgi:hypothetical protein
MGLTSILVQGEKQKGIVYIVTQAQTKVKKTGSEEPVVKTRGGANQSPG